MPGIDDLGTILTILIDVAIPPLLVAVETLEHGWDALVSSVVHRINCCELHLVKGAIRVEAGTCQFAEFIIESCRWTCGIQEAGGLRHRGAFAHSLLLAGRFGIPCIQ